MTTENNKIIAEFMGLVKSSINNEYWTKKSKEGSLISPNYNSDWGLLMEVVEKIESLKLPYDGFSWSTKPFSVMINRNSVHIQVDAGKSDDLIFPDRHCNNKIELVYNTCVEFIKWYNENSTKNRKRL